MNNMFSNAYYGKPYKTRDGRKAIYIEQHDNIHRLLSEGCFGYRIVNTRADGYIFDYMTDKDDIVSEWQEPINEEELDKLAMDASLKFPLLNPKEGKGVAFYKGFKVGYKKAMEDKQ